MTRKIVHKIEDGVDPQSVYCTTYQMRNFYKQLADGFYSSLDVMNYIQHQVIVDRIRKDHLVLYVCCGRGRLLPLLRWYRPKIAGYVGVDICETNIGEQSRWSGSKRIEGLDYYPFPVRHVICSCEEMSDELEESSFDSIVYTSSIEHMQKDVGEKSLVCCHKLVKQSGRLYLSCPNTMDKKDPYDTQYAAHVYEWGLDELREALKRVGFVVMEEYGLVAKVRDFERFVKTLPEKERSIYFRLKQYLPSRWLMAMFPVLYPEAASEVMLVCRKKGLVC